MSLDLKAQKEKFLKTLRDSVQREGVEKLIEWLERSDFFTAPASTRYHGAYEGGLCEHSMDVFDKSWTLATALGVECDAESIAIASILHDLCKVNFYKPDVKNQKIDGVWQQVPYYTIEEKYSFGGHGSKSVFICQQFMKLTPEEAAAINCHMGCSDGADVRYVSQAYKQFPLAWLIHAADEAATYLLDRG